MNHMDPIIAEKIQTACQQMFRDYSVATPVSIYTSVKLFFAAQFFILKYLPCNFCYNISISSQTNFF